MKGIALKDRHLSLSTGAVELIRHRIIIRRKRTLYISALQMLLKANGSVSNLEVHRAQQLRTTPVIVGVKKLTFLL
jgi:hypothetical protein